MKQILALILCLALFMQLAACGTPSTTESTNPETTTAQQPPSETQPAPTEITESLTEPLVTMPENITDIRDFEDFKDMMEEEFDISETVDAEGNTLIEIRPSEDTEQDSVITDPVVPGIDTIVRPTEPKPIEPEYTYTTGQHHTALHYSQRYLYSILSEEEQIWYQKIDVAVRNLEDRVDLGADMTTNKNYNVYYLYMMDNPEHFYLINRVGCYSNSAGEDGLIFGYSDGTYYCGMGYGNATDALRSGIRAKQAVFNRELQRIISTIPANAPAL